MRYSICIIDDEIPATGIEGIRDSDLLNSSNLKFLLNQETKPWTDEIVKNLIRTLLEQTAEDGTPKWDVYGYTNPAFYINTLNDGVFRTDILVFDWDYPGGGSETDAESLLKEILERTFSLVFIFSKADKQTEIAAIMAKPEFLEYKERLLYLDKAINQVDQTNVLLQKADEMSANNFSFRFARNLRVKSVQIMDKLLSELGRATLSDIKNYLRLEPESEKRDLVDFIAERFRAGLATSDIPDLNQPAQTTTSTTSPVDNELAKKIWAYRLYLPSDSTINSADELVRKGDLVKIGEEYFLVVSADCDLQRFWRKNLGTINLLPLHRLHNSNNELKELLTFCVSPGDLKQGDFGHLTSKIGKLVEGPFILPFVKIGTEFENFVALPKEFTGRRINIHTDVAAVAKDGRKDLKLKYAWWSGAEKLCSVSEPFLTAIVQHTFTTIGGYGAPDYPPAMKSIMGNILDDFNRVGTSSPSQPSAGTTV